MQKPQQTTQPAILAPEGPYDYAQCPPSSPWGRVQETTILMWAYSPDGTRVPVLWQVHTAGHGGTRVHRQLAARFLNRLPKECHAYGGNRLWYEEDCESNVPLFIFYNGLDPSCWLVTEGQQFPRERLMESIRRWMPDTGDAVCAIAARFDAVLVKNGHTLRSPLPAQHSV